MKIAEIQFTPWEKIYHFDPQDIALAVGDSVVVKTEIGIELGRVVGFRDVDRERLSLPTELKPVTRKATTADLERVANKEKEHTGALAYCKGLMAKHHLPMKLVDVHFSFDGGRITFAFIADGRIDFRDLVKDLTRHFQKSIRLHQLGVRDEAKMCGDVGSCGRNLCCNSFLRKLGNISSELAEQQQVAHRGSERISGACGRLMCCLSYEQKMYEECLKKMPPLGSTIKTQKGRGRVIGWHTLKQTVDVRVDDDTVLEVNVNK